MKHDLEKAALLSDPLSIGVGLPIGNDGAFVAGGSGGGRVRRSC